MANHLESNDQRPWKIYVLKCPKSMEIRYVGWTTIPLHKRLQKHIYRARCEQSTYRTRWINSLLNSSLLPIIEEIESGQGEGWSAAERRWIAYYRNQGTRLVNTTDGGEGALGFRLSKEAIRERKERFNATHTANERSDIARKREAAKTPEQRAASARKRLLTMTPEQHRMVRQKQIASMTPEQRSASAKKQWDRMTPDDRRAMARRMTQGITREQRVAAAAKAKITIGVGVRSESARRMWANRTPEQRAAMREKGVATFRANQSAGRCSPPASVLFAAPASVPLQPVKEPLVTTISVPANQ